MPAHRVHLDDLFDEILGESVDDWNDLLGGIDGGEDEEESTSGLQDASAPLVHIIITRRYTALTAKFSTGQLLALISALSAGFLALSKFIS